MSAIISVELYDVSVVVDEPEKYIQADPPAEYLLINSRPKQHRIGGWVYVRNDSALVARVRSVGIEIRDSRPERIGDPPGDRGKGPVLLIDATTWDDSLYYDLSEYRRCFGQGIRYLTTNPDDSIQHYVASSGEPMGSMVVCQSQRNQSSNHEQIYQGSDEYLLEGEKMSRTSVYYTRNQKARKLCIEKYGYNCFVCEMNFVETYGELGEDFIHVHHLTPISSSAGASQIDVDDLRPLCPNCHSMIHRKKPMLSIDELKEVLERAVS